MSCRTAVPDAGAHLESRRVAPEAEKTWYGHGTVVSDALRTPQEISKIVGSSHTPA